MTYVDDVIANIFVETRILNELSFINYSCDKNKTPNYKKKETCKTSNLTFGFGNFSVFELNRVDYFCKRIQTLR